MKDRAKILWSVLREQRVGDVVDKAREYLENVAYGADPIEAMHGHLCGPKCMHWDAIPKARQEQLKKAPWNRKGTP